MAFARMTGSRPAKGAHYPQGVVQGRALRLGAFLRFGVIGLFAIFLLAPLYWVVVTSIKPTSDYLQTPPVWFPAHPTSIHYSTALNQMRGWQGLENSLIVSVCVTILAVAIGACAGYSMARFQTGGQHLAFWVMSQRCLAPIAPASASCCSTPCSSCRSRSG